MTHGNSPCTGHERGGLLGWRPDMSAGVGNFMQRQERGVGRAKQPLDTQHNKDLHHFSQCCFAFIRPFSQQTIGKGALPLGSHWEIACSVPTTVILACIYCTMPWDHTCRCNMPWWISSCCGCPRHHCSCTLACTATLQHHRGPAARGTDSLEAFTFSTPSGAPRNTIQTACSVHAH